jgi:2-aminoadipate transaminase
MYAPKEILAVFNTAKQAADLHSNFLCQQILARYLETHDLDSHIRKIVAVYGRQCRLMCDLFDDLMPALAHTTPEGGMFLTATLPRGLSAMQVFREGIDCKVAVLPGMPFFVDGGGDDTIRLNFSNADEEKIKDGMHRLAGVINRHS